MTPQNSVECWIMSPDNHVLLLKVHAIPGKHGSFWQPITGGIETGETPIQGALREIMEETGLQLTTSNLSEIASGLTFQLADELTVSKTVFAARTAWTNVSINPGEHQDYKWVPASEVSDTLFWDSNRTTWMLLVCTMA